MFYTCLGALVLLLFLRRDWGVPEALLPPRWLLAGAGGWPSFLRLEPALEGAEQWALFGSSLLDAQLKTAERLRLGGLRPACSLTHSSGRVCVPLAAPECAGAADERCLTRWLQKATARSPVCFQAGTPVTCGTTNR